MGYRAVYFYGVNSFLWAALGFFQLLLNDVRYQVPLFSAIVAITSGLIIGTFFGATVALKQLQFLTKKGETRVSLTTWLLVIGATFILLGVWQIWLFLVVSEPIEILTIALDFLSPAVPASLAARTILFVNWERKHKRTILYANLVSSRLYVFPRMDEVQLSQT
jgi:hypothetical protein